MTLVVGATGILGGQICGLLAKAGKKVRALVRATSEPLKVEELKSLGAEIVKGDLKNPGSLRPACAGVESVISTASSTLSRQEGDGIETVDHKGQLSLVEAAKQAGVRHFVLTSFRDDPDIQHPLTRAKRAVERAMRESGMTYTIVWAPPFMEVWLGPNLGFDYNAGRVRIFGTGEQKISWISMSDMAELCVAALDNPAARNKELDIGGPEALSPLEAVAIFEEISGKKFEVEKVPVKALMDQKAAAKTSMEETFAGLMLQCSRDWAVDMSKTLKSFPVKLTSVRDYARQVVKS